MSGEDLTKCCITGYEIAALSSFVGTLVATTDINGDVLVGMANTFLSGMRSIPTDEIEKMGSIISSVGIDGGFAILCARATERKADDNCNCPDCVARRLVENTRSDKGQSGG